MHCTGLTYMQLATYLRHGVCATDLETTTEENEFFGKTWPVVGVRL